MQFEYEIYNKSISDEELLFDLKRVFDIFDTKNLTMKQYSIYGKYNCSTFIRRFGTWNKTLEKLKISPFQQFYTEKNLFQNIKNVWIKKGKTPTRRDMDNKNFSNISSGAYLRKYGKWSDALKAFVEYINIVDNQEQNIVVFPQKRENNNHITKRDINLRLRFKVLMRDNFKCCICGASPAKDSSVELHVDHIKPWSKGGETTIDNLQTLCSKCNLGKSDLDME